MKIKMTQIELQTWLRETGCEVTEERLVSAISTNMYLNNNGVIAIYDNGTVNLQGKPPLDFINSFKDLCEKKSLSKLNSTDPISDEDVIFLGEDTNIEGIEKDVTDLSDFFDQMLIEAKTPAVGVQVQHNVDVNDDDDDSGW